MEKILFYFTSMTPAGGIERVISTLANQFCQFVHVTILVKDKAYSHYPLNDKVKLVSLDATLTLDMNNRIKRVGQAGVNFLYSSKKLATFLNNNEFDLYYLAHPLNALEFHFARGIDEKVIITEHGAIDAYNVIYKKIKSWLYPKAKCYVVPTTLDAEVYQSLGFPVVYIPHFKSNLPYKQRVFDKKIALSVGRMTEAKRQWILIDLWKDIVYEHGIKDWQLHIVGEGNLKPSYLKKIADYQLEDFVKILPPVKNVEQYYQQAGIFLLTSQSEGFGMVLLEAISFGIPCITYESPPGPRDIIQNQYNGYLIAMDNYEQFKEATLDLITNHDKINKMSKQAYQSSLIWSDENIMKKWKEIL